MKRFKDPTGRGIQYDDFVDAIAICAPKTVYDQVGTRRLTSHHLTPFDHLMPVSLCC